VDERLRWRWAIVPILIAAAILRFWNLDSGLPYAPGVDEPQIMESAVSIMKSGDLHPRTFIHPSLYIYTEFLVATIAFLVGATAGQWSSLASAGVEQFYLPGRAMTALIGTATVLIVYRVGLPSSSSARPAGRDRVLARSMRSDRSVRLI
jgi:hypothetical protein